MSEAKPTARTTSEAKPTVRPASAVPSNEVKAGRNTAMQVLVGPEQGDTSFALRRFMMGAASSTSSTSCAAARASASGTRSTRSRRTTRSSFRRACRIPMK